MTNDILLIESNLILSEDELSGESEDNDYLDDQLDLLNEIDGVDNVQRQSYGNRTTTSSDLRNRTMKNNDSADNGDQKIPDVDSVKEDYNFYEDDLIAMGSL